MKQLLILALFIFFISSCDNPRNYTIEELEKNKYNDLQLRVQPALDAEGFESLIEEFQAMNSEEILNRLSAKNLELHRASFGFYYLANSYASEGEIEKALHFHKIAASQYLNPQSMLKLAEWYFVKEKDYPKAYEALHQSLEIKVEITENNRSHPLSMRGKDKTQYILQELEKLGKSGAFDRAATRKKLMQDLTPMVDTYRQIYGLGPRDGEDPS